MKEKYLLAWMDNVGRFAETSEAKRLKVAAFLFKDGNVISHACNGTPVGWETNECEDKVYARDEIGRMHSRIPDGVVNIEKWMSEEYPFMDDLGMYRLVTKDCVVHAEEQCLQKMWHSHETTDNTAMLISHSPCFKCSLKIKSAGIKKVYYRHNYRSTEGIEYLVANSVHVEQI